MMNKINDTIKVIALALGLAVSGNIFAGEVNINTADADTIASNLNGIGLSKAQAIVAWRDKNGQFTDLSSLQEVKGIGEKTLEKNKPFIQF